MNPVRPRKRLGQHFLRDGNVIQRIVGAIGPQPGEALVEIGPGVGAITAPLLQRAGGLDVIEVDSRVLPQLEQSCLGLGELRIHQQDVLRFELAELSRGGRLRLVGNLPYNVSSPILFHVLAAIDCVQDAHFMLQREVADRLVAKPAERDYGRLSVMVQYWCESQSLFRIGSGSFWPPPKVESSLVRLTPRRPQAPAALEVAALDVVVRAAFGQRRKQLANALRGVLDPATIASCGIDPAARAETLSVREFVALADAFSSRRAASAVAH